MSTWFVTGATGFVGRHTLAALLDRGISVRALVRGTSPPTPPRVLRVEAPLDDFDALVGAIQGAEVVLHLAAPRRRFYTIQGRQISSGHRPGDPGTLAVGTENLVRAAAAAGARRCVVASSTSVYGPRWRGVDEGTDVAPRTPYARWKLEGDRRAVRAASESNMEIVLLRLSEIYGPGGDNQLPLVQAVAKGRFRITGSGRTSHQLLEVRDAARALTAAGTVAMQAPCTSLIVSGPGNTFGEWIGAIAEAVGTVAATSPALDVPGRALVRSLSRVPGVHRSARFRSLEYHLRPRSFAVDRSVEILGPYHASGLRSSVDEMVAEFRGEGHLD